MPLDLQRPVTQRPARLPALWLAALLAWTCTQGAAAAADSAASRAAVLDAAPGLRASLGRHVVAGYRRPSQIRLLAGIGAIGGIFITRHNVAGRSRTAVAREIAALQELRRAMNLPPLIVATDQEGGQVSKLSPPLPRPPSLRAVLRTARARTRTQHRPPFLGLAPEVAAAIQAHAHEQGRQLAALGVTLNFAPVVDLDPGRAVANDRHSRIWQRAIAADGETVVAVAGIYCAGLAAAGVMCTLKHFPGLGRVATDTHFRMANLNAHRRILEASDWRPFRELGHNRNVAIMLGHVRAEAVDPQNAASVSAAAVTLIRRDWGVDAVLITDDLCMGAIRKRTGGIGAAAVDALAAGVDLVLVSRDGHEAFTALAALIAAHGEGRLAEARRARSLERLATILTLPSP